MTRAVVVVLLAFAAACARPSSGREQELVDRAVELIGGADRLMSARSLLAESEGIEAVLGQGVTPYGELPTWRLTRRRSVHDLVNGRLRVEQMREPTASSPEAQPRLERLGLDRTVAYDGTADGARRAPAAVAAMRRIEMLHHPLVLLRAAVDAQARLTRRRQENGFDVVDLLTAAGDEVTLGFDPAYGTLTMAWSPIADPILGDTTIETAFYRYEETGGLGLPRRLVSRIDRYPLRDLRVIRNVLNSDIGDIAAPAPVRAAAAPPDVPVPNVTTTQVIPHVWRLAGESHHSVLIELADSLWLFEVPASEERTLAVIARARQIRPGKPLTHAIVSHHHFDHLAGLRAAVSEGLTIVTHRVNEGVVRDLVARRHRRAPDALERRPRALQLELVDANRVLDDPRNPLFLSKGPETPHAHGVLVAYLRRGVYTLADGFRPSHDGPGVVVQADLFDAAGTSPSLAARLYDHLITQSGYTTDSNVVTHVPIHGPQLTQADLVSLLPATP